MKTLITCMVVLLSTFNLQAQDTDIRVLNGRYINGDGSYFSGTYSEYVEGRKISTVTVNNGLLNGMATYYYEDGAVKISGYFKKGLREGQWKEFNETGSLTAISNFSKGLKHGKWEIWDDTGSLRFEMYYNMGEKTGVWKMWDENGVLTTKSFGQ